MALTITLKIGHYVLRKFGTILDSGELEQVAYKFMWRHKSTLQFTLKSPVTP